MIIYIFLFSETFFTTRMIGGMKISHEGRNARGCAQSAYNLKYYII